MKPARGIVEPPRELSGRARAEWDRMAPELDRLGLLTQMDLTAFAAYCDSVATLEGAMARIKKQGRYLEGKRAPWVIDSERAKAEILRFSQRFGFTPSDRAGMGGAGEEKGGGEGWFKKRA